MGKFKTFILSGKKHTKIMRCMISSILSFKKAKIYWQERSVLVSREWYCEKRVDWKETGKTLRSHENFPDHDHGGGYTIIYICKKTHQSVHLLPVGFILYFTSMKLTK